MTNTTNQFPGYVPDVRTTTPAGLTATEPAYVASLPYRDRVAATYRRHVARMPSTAPAHIRRMASAIHLSIWDASRVTG